MPAKCYIIMLGWYGLYNMKDFKLLVWLTQLGLSIALPLAGFILLSIWLRNRFALGSWVVICGCAVGLICAIDGFKTSMRAMTLMTKDKKESDNPVSFNDHE